VISAEKRGNKVLDKQALIFQIGGVATTK